MSEMTERERLCAEQKKMMDDAAEGLWRHGYSRAGYRDRLYSLAARYAQFEKEIEALDATHPREGTG